MGKEAGTGRGGWADLYCCGGQLQSLVSLVLQIKREQKHPGRMGEDACQKLHLRCCHHYKQYPAILPY